MNSSIVWSIVLFVGLLYVTSSPASSQVDSTQIARVDSTAATEGESEPDPQCEGWAQFEVDDCPEYAPTLAPGAIAPALLDLFDLTTYDFISAAVSFNEDKVKLTVTPFKALPDEPWLKELRATLGRGSGDYTLGIGWGYNNASPLGARADTAIARAFRERRPPGPEEDADSYAKDVLNPLYLKAYRDLMAGSFAVTAGGTLQFFEELSGDPLDRDNNESIDNAHTFKGLTLQVGGTFVPVESMSLSGSYFPRWNRPSAVDTAEVAFYHGFAAGASVRLKILRDDYATTREFVNSFFIPSVYLGVAYEGLLCQDDVCTDDIEGSHTLTPYLDFRVTQEHQFRLGFSFRRTSFVEGVDEDESKSGPFMKYLFHFGPPS